MVEQDLTRLIQQAKSGDIDAFAALVTRFKGEVFRHAYAMVNDRMEAEDIAQEAFVKAYYSLDKLEHAYAFASWMARIVSNLCYDRLKKLKKKAALQTEMDEETLSRPASNIERANLRFDIRDAMEKLSPEHRTALVLRDIEGYSYDEIAKIMRIPLGTVKSRINTARKALKNELSRG
ncbi:RNA polymerase sigma factor [Weizmannia acidilactici]|uniref:RNA polymerase sigma factor n=1 Tax=Weizmannia acidilactici TaxID=2607726 RepID=A0A5J4JED9_9BACI|nr:sigma-70 family RNA polymerase sigma factor [Weizmannia acidilactici]GER65903.1 RNA polymerase sigma factor [Weizmannia acidilactici]GER69769.1 RNA polymerase sigma factor [Weizmannia acidilactici]GER73196.1 RNA polymerase sigma factor [Weizmannia acidilactici]